MITKVDGFRTLFTEDKIQDSPDYLHTELYVIRKLNYEHIIEHAPSLYGFFL